MPNLLNTIKIPTIHLSQKLSTSQASDMNILFVYIFIL